MLSKINITGVLFLLTILFFLFYSFLVPIFDILGVNPTIIGYLGIVSLILGPIFFIFFLISLAFSTFFGFVKKKSDQQTAATETANVSEQQVITETETKRKGSYWLKGILISVPVFVVLFFPLILVNGCDAGLACIVIAFPSLPFLTISFPLSILIATIFRDPDYLGTNYILFLGVFGFFYFLFLGGLIGWLIDEGIKHKGGKIFIRKVIYVVVIAVIFIVSLIIINLIIPDYTDTVRSVDFKSDEGCHQGLNRKIDNTLGKMKIQLELDNPGYKYSITSMYIVYSPVLDGCIYQYIYDSYDANLNEFSAPSIARWRGIVEYNTEKVLYEINYNWSDDKEEIDRKDLEFGNKFRYYWTGSSEFK